MFGVITADEYQLQMLCCQQTLLTASQTLPATEDFAMTINGNINGPWPATRGCTGINGYNSAARDLSINYTAVACISRPWRVTR